MGDVLTAQGNLPGAFDAYQASLAIRERLAAQDPQNAGWQRDLAVSFSMLYHSNHAAGNDEEAARALHRCHEVLERMRRAGMYLDPPLQQLLEQLDEQLGGSPTSH